MLKFCRNLTRLKKILSHLKNNQLADLMRFWYIFRVKAAEDLGIEIHR